MPEKYKTSEVDNKAKSLETAIADIAKAGGRIVRWSSQDVKPIHVIPTGVLSLDMALGVGGIPRGRVIEIYGQEGGGKTTLSLSVLAQAQKAGGTVAFIDAEHALDPAYAAKIGVDLDSMLISQPDSGEQALEITEKLVRSGALDLIVIDSVAALVPKAEIEGEMGDLHVGLQARLMGQALRKLTSLMAETKTCVIFLNQLRNKVGCMFGNPETTPGGLALKFYSSVRIDIRKIEIIKRGEEAVGTRVRAKVIKNKVAPPYRQTEFNLLMGSGPDTELDLLETGERYGIIKKSGAHYHFAGNTIGQGADKAASELRAHPGTAATIKAEILKAAAIPIPDITETSGAEQ